MTGTPSRTTTAQDGGTKRHSIMEEAVRKEAIMTRGSVERKLKAKLWSEEHKPYMRQPHEGQGRVEVTKPNSHPARRRYIRQMYEAKVTRLTPGDLSVCSEIGSDNGLMGKS